MGSGAGRWEEEVRKHAEISVSKVCRVEHEGFYKVLRVVRSACLGR